MGFSSPSPPSSSRSASASSASSSFSVFTVIQYAFLALAAYVLAGAPLLEMLGGGGSSLESSRADVGSMSPAKLEAIAPVNANLTCAPHAFKNVHVLSREPLVVYIEGFLSPEETDEVVALR